MCNIYDDNRHVTTKLSYRAFRSGFVIGKLFFKKDIRQFGSGNTGATNSFRVLGRPAGFLVTFLRYFQRVHNCFLPFMVTSSCIWP